MSQSPNVLHLKFVKELPEVPCHILSLRNHDVSTIDLSFQQLLNSAPSHTSFVAVDTEWRPERVKRENRLDLLQFATSDFCIIVQVHGQNVLPPCVSTILTNKTILKVLKGHEEDVRRFKDYFGVTVSNFFDIGDIFRDMGLRSRPDVVDRAISHPHAVFRSINYTSVLKKNTKVTMSNWSNLTLTKPQIEYSALDAYHIALVYGKLSSGDLATSFPGQWLKKESSFQKGNVVCCLSTSPFPSVYAVSTYLSSLFTSYVHTVYDKCRSCGFSRGCFNGIEQCCPKQEVYFLAVCRTCHETFEFPSALKDHLHDVNPIRSKKGLTDSSRICRDCDVLLTSNDTKILLAHVLGSSNHEDIRQLLYNCKILSKNFQLHNALEYLFQNAETPPLIECFKNLERTQKQFKDYCFALKTAEQQEEMMQVLQQVQTIYDSILPEQRQGKHRTSSVGGNRRGNKGKFKTK
ncbi:hypothetical protein GEMRC1_011621 [Eukaryota sp. GEM-RC1]